MNHIIGRAIATFAVMGFGAYTIPLMAPLDHHTVIILFMVVALAFIWLE